MAAIDAVADVTLGADTFGADLSRFASGDWLQAASRSIILRTEDAAPWNFAPHRIPFLALKSRL